MHDVSEGEHGDSLPLQFPGGIDATGWLRFGRGCLVFFVTGFIPVIVGPVGGYSPGDSWYYGRWERDGKVVRANGDWGFGFLERRESG